MISQFKFILSRLNVLVVFIILLLLPVAVGMVLIEMLDRLLARLIK